MPQSMPYKAIDECAKDCIAYFGFDVNSYRDQIKESILMTQTEQKEILQLPKELIDHLKILEHSAKSGKYPPNNWLNADGRGCDHKSQYASIFRHVAEAYNFVKKDKDSGLDPRLHAAIRLMMDYTRDQKGLVHPLDDKVLKEDLK